MARSLSVIIPIRNELDKLHLTLASIIDACADLSLLEIILVDDCSEKPVSTADLSAIKNASIHVIRSERRLGVPGARNLGALHASGDVFFMTDSHVRFCTAWDRIIRENLRSDGLILAGTVADDSSNFRGFGCKLVVPFMGTHWERDSSKLSPSREVQVASCAATAISCNLFKELGGYDSGMRLYGSAEPEFSVRAWLYGAQIVSVEALEVTHRFKSRHEAKVFVQPLRPFMVHNSLRFGCLYLSIPTIYQMLRYYSLLFPDAFESALEMLDINAAFERRRYLKTVLANDFSWFIDKFSLLDQVGQEICR
jgi:glycosyltransferase involved in cell wall biosynthesis